MPKEPRAINCQLICYSSAEQLTQLYTGFGALHRRGLVQLKFTRSSDYQPGIIGSPILEVILENSRRIVYDTADREDIFQDHLESCDYYFKRSFSQSYISNLPKGNKVYPLGFNYPVYGPHDHSFLRSIWSLKDFKSLHKKVVWAQVIRSSRLLARLFNTSGGRSTSQINAFEGLPSYSSEPRILFMARTWASKRGKSSEIMDERQYINYMRVNCVRKLRKEFGQRFMVGIIPDDYSTKYYKDCLIREKNLTHKRSYLKLLKDANICIATMGLKRSNGWKLAEYIAGAKAIVSEKIFYSVPGKFKPGINYSEFSSPDECVSKTIELVEQPQKRYEMMKSNHAYYNAFLRPDMLVWNTLQVVIKDQLGIK